MLRYLLLIVLLTLQIENTPAAFYKCKAPNGEITYQATACEQQTEAVGIDTKTLLKEPSKINNEEYRATTHEIGLDNSGEALIFRARFVAALASLKPLTITLSDYYWQNGVWPTKFKQIGIEKKELHNARIDSVKLERNGVIHAYLNREYGSNKQIMLTPKTVMGGQELEWECASNFPKALLSDQDHYSSVCKSRMIE